MSKAKISRQKGNDPNWLTLVDFKKRHPKSRQKDPRSLEIFERIVGIFEASARHVGEYVLVVRHEVEDEGKMGCMGWERLPQTSHTVYLGVLRSVNTRMRETFWEFEFDTGGVFACKQEGNAALEHSNLRTKSVFSLFRDVVADYGLFRAPQLEIIIGDEAVEKWCVDMKEQRGRRYDFDELSKVLGRPNKAMTEAQNRKDEAERKELSIDIKATLNQLKESLKRADELSMGDEDIVKTLRKMLAEYKG